MTTDVHAIQLSGQHQDVVNRFMAACEADARIVAAFMGGSNARGEADVHSDLDLCVIVTEDTYADFVAGREQFLQQLGRLVFVEDFGLPDVVFSIFASGAEVELHLGSEAHLDRIHSGPFTILVDKTGILNGMTFTEEATDPAEQTETLRRLIYGFWHELSHFITAMGRGQLWWAYGQLEALREGCVSLARLQHDFFTWAGGDEPYFKIEAEMPVETIAPLLVTCVSRQPGPMLDAARVIVGFYRELAATLAQAHGIPYPIELDRVMTHRMNTLQDD
jgi:predicted nucleotidyltransferase